MVAIMSIPRRMLESSQERKGRFSAIVGSVHSQASLTSVKVHLKRSSVLVKETQISAIKTHLWQLLCSLIKLLVLMRSV